LRRVICIYVVGLSTNKEVCLSKDLQQGGTSQWPNGYNN